MTKNVQFITYITNLNTFVGIVQWLNIQLSPPLHNGSIFRWFSVLRVQAVLSPLLKFVPCGLAHLAGKKIEAKLLAFGRHGTHKYTTCPFHFKNRKKTVKLETRGRYVHGQIAWAGSFLKPDMFRVYSYAT